MYDNYKTNGGILFKDLHGDLVLVVPKAMRTEVIKNYHEQGHFGVTKTEELIRRQFFIPRLEERIKLCIKNCVPCILADRKMGMQEGLLNPIPKGDLPLMVYHIDHLGHLESTSKKYQYILCIIDAFTKFVWLYPTKTTNCAEVLQKLELQKAVFGNPAHIISDKGAAFTSTDFKEYCKKEGICDSTTTAGVARVNGQVERINRIILPCLSKMSLEKPAEWYKHTNDLQRFINNSWQRSIALSPFEMMMGVKMRCPEDVRLREILEEKQVENFMEERLMLRDEAKKKISQIQEENRQNYNKKRKEATKYEVGDVVVIKRTQFGGGSKLQPKYLGPYEVIRVNGWDRYNVRKLGQGEGPKNTSTCAEYMKKYFHDDETELLSPSGSEDDCRKAEWEFGQPCSAKTDIQERRTYIK